MGFCVKRRTLGIETLTVVFSLGPQSKLTKRERE